MTKPMVTIHNLETDEIITREMNDEEFTQYNTLKTAFEENKIAEQAKAQAKAALLAQLGITEEQAKLLLS